MFNDILGKKIKKIGASNKTIKKHEIEKKLQSTQNTFLTMIHHLSKDEEELFDMIEDAIDKKEDFIKVFKKEVEFLKEAIEYIKKM